MSYGTLTLHLSNGETAVVELTISEVVLGRSRQATIRLNDDLVSKLHVRLTVKQDGVWLEDLAATNGTFIDSKQIPAHQPLQIRPGQTVQIGDTVFQYAPPYMALNAAEPSEIEAPPATLDKKKDDAEPAWRKPLILFIAALMLLLLCGLIAFSGWWFMGGGQSGNEQMPPNGVPLAGTVTLEACPELPMTAVSPENAAYQQLLFLDLPFAYGDTAAAFRQAVQRSQAGGRINSFFDHLYPIYPSPPQTSAISGLEPAEPLVGGHTLLFSGQLNNSDNYSGHPGYDFAPEDPRQATTAVLAAADGIITEVGVDESGANYVKLAHLVQDVGNFQTSYWHLEADSFLADTDAKIGEFVPAGTRLGTMGNSGWGAGIQLHFEVRFDQDQNGRFTLDEAIDPFGYLPSPAYPQDPWSHPTSFTDGRGDTYSHAGQPSRYLWRYANGVLTQVGENGGGLILGQADTGLNQTALCAPVGSLPAGGAVALAWAPDPVDVPERVGVGLSCQLSVADANKNQVTQFAQPVRLELPLSAADLSQVRTETLAIYWQDAAGEAWQALPTFIDETQNIAAVEVDRPGACALLGVPTADVMAPVSTIDITGATGANDVWYDAVTIAINSSEDAAQIEYSLDAGKTWQPYTAPFTLKSNGELVPPRSEPVEDFGSGPGQFLVLAAATDNEGNRENPPAFRHFIIDPSKNPDNVNEATPTDTPLPETEAGCEPEITVLAQFGVNVRRGPGLEYGIVTSLPQGTTAPIIGRNATGSWWRLDLDVGTSSEYWVSDDVVDAACAGEVPVVATPPPPTSTPTPTPTATPTTIPTTTPTTTPTATPTGDPDTVAPVVSVGHAPTSPDESETVAFTAQASDKGGVVRIEVWVQAPGESGMVRRKVCEDVTVCVYQGGPYTAGDGEYRAFAWDAAGNQGVTAVMSFTVIASPYP